MKTTKKLLLIATFIIIWFIFINHTSAQWSSTTSNLEDCQWFWADFEACWIWDIKWIAWTQSANTTEDSLIDTIKKFINRVLGILSLITLVILLRGGFQMVTAAWDDTKYKAWFKILKQAAIWLIFIWLSRLVISMIFWIISLITN